jgi:tetratricopeptide (TPR) repeat protein
MVVDGQDRRVSVRAQAFCAAVLICARFLIAADADISEKLRQARDLMRQGNWTQAGAIVDQVLEASADDLAAQYWKSYVLFQTGKYETSAVYASRYVERNPTSADGHKILGLASFMQEQQALAESELQRACELSPQDAEARYYLGRVQFERQNLPAALESFRTQVTLEPQSVRGYNHLGQTLEGLARLDEARSAYVKAIELEQTQARKSEWPYFNLGVMALKQGHTEEAIRWLREALVRRPSWSDAKVQLAVALGAAKQLDEAARLLNEVLAAEPKNATAHYQLGRLLLKMRRPEEARRHFELFSSYKQK